MKFYFGEWAKDPSVPWMRRAAPWEARWAFDFSNLEACGSKAQRSGMGLFVVNDDVNLPTDYILLHEGGWDTAPVERNRENFRRLTGSAVCDGDTFQDWLLSALLFGGDPQGLDHFKPLMPSSRTWQLPLPDRGLWWKQFDINAPEAQTYQEMKQLEYAEMYARAKAGDLIGPKGVDEEFHRKYLDFVGKQMGISNPEDFFIPDHLPKEGRVPHETTYSESFNKANSATLGPDLTWTKVAGTGAEVVSNQCDMVTTSGFDECRARAEHDVSTSDLYVQFTLAAIGNLGGTSAMGRYQSGADSGYHFGILQYDTASYQWAFAKWEAGTETEYPIDGEDDLTTVPTIGHVIRFEVSGSTLTGYSNSVQLIQTTDTTFATGTRGGFRILEDGGAATIDAWSIGDLTSGTGGRNMPLLGIG